MNRETCMRRRFVLLDRDGTINVDRHYISDPKQVELLPGAAEGLRELSQLGLGLIVVTNQSGIGRRYFTETNLHAVHNRLCKLLRDAGVSLDAIYFCPHIPSDGCVCRKPAAGLVRRAAADFDFDPRDSFLVGDKPSDIELGKSVGAVTLLVKPDRSSEAPASTGCVPDFEVPNLVEAAAVISRLLSGDRTASVATCGSETLS